MSRKLAYSSMVAAFAIVLSYVEFLIPFNIGIPGAKLGLANFAILIALYYIGAGEAAVINLVRIIVVGLLFGNLISICFSIAGAVVSFAIMCLFKKLKLFSVIAVSIAGGVSHNIGQIIVASILVSNYGALIYTPVLIVTGIITGAIIGLLVMWLDKRIKNILKPDWL